MVSKKICVGLLFGGRSGEHEVSLASARSVLENIDGEKYEVVSIGITKEGQWIVGSDPMQALLSEGVSQGSAATLLADPSRRGLWNIDPAPCNSAVPQEPQAAGSQLQSVDQPALSPDCIRAVRLAELDVVFPALHGTFGEDGTVQGLLELAGVPYVGCGVLASALAMDKIAANDVFVRRELPVLPYVAVKRKAWQHDPEQVIAEIERQLSLPPGTAGQAAPGTDGCYPLFVKPANLGSSVGITKVHRREELAPALDLAARYDRKLVVQRGIEAREIEVSVLGNDDPIASVPGEVIPCREFYDYRAKYIDEDSELLIPAPLGAEMTGRVRKMAITAYKALDCAGMARADFLLDKTSGELWINELNTIPGFTQISMYPKLWEASGIPYPELIDRLIALALERFEDRRSSETSYTVELDE